VFYLNYWTEKKYQRYQSDFGGAEFKQFRTLIVTTSQARLKNLREAVTKVSFNPPHVKRFLWATTQEKLLKQSVFAPIWNALDTNDQTLYAIGQESPWKNQRFRR
jgi:hypothetical protein